MKKTVRSQTPTHTLAVIAVLVALVVGSAVRAQELPAPSQQLPSPGVPGTSRTTVAAPCVEPPPTVDLMDYNGPLKKTIGVFARNLERKAVHPPHYQPGLVLCSLEVSDKFALFVRDTFDPVTFIATGFNAALDQARNQDPSFGQGAAGYGKRFGADFVDQASFKFFKDFAYPSIFSEDPRYYRLIHGSNGTRLWHAVNHAFVAYRYDGARTFNVSEWLGTTSAVTLGNLYHPGNERGFAPAAEQVGFHVILDMGFDVLREFFPEIAQKLKLPFRTDPVPSNSAPNSGPR